MKKFVYAVLGMSLVAGSAALSWAAPAVPAESGTIEIATRPRSSNGRTTVRRYRSYSIQPGGNGEAVASGAIAAPVYEPRVYSAPSSSGRSSKPSYMRAHSKAHGRFHQ